MSKENVEQRPMTLAEKLIYAAAFARNGYVGAALAVRDLRYAAEQKAELSNENADMLRAFLADEALS